MSSVVKLVTAPTEFRGQSKRPHQELENGGGTGSLLVLERLGLCGVNHLVAIILSKRTKNFLPPNFQTDQEQQTAVDEIMSTCGIDEEDALRILMEDDVPTFLREKTMRPDLEAYLLGEEEIGAPLEADLIPKGVSELQLFLDGFDEAYESLSRERKFALLKNIAVSLAGELDELFDENLRVLFYNGVGVMGESFDSAILVKVMDQLEKKGCPDSFLRLLEQVAIFGAKDEIGRSGQRPLNLVGDGR